MIRTGRKVVMISALGGSATALVTGLIAYLTGALHVALAYVSQTVALVQGAAQGAAQGAITALGQVTFDNVLAVLGVLALPIAFVAAAFVILGND